MLLLKRGEAVAFQEKDIRRALTERWDGRLEKVGIDNPVSKILHALGAGAGQMRRLTDTIDRMGKEGKLIVRKEGKYITLIALPREEQRTLAAEKRRRAVKKLAAEADEDSTGHEDGELKELKELFLPASREADDAREEIVRLTELLEGERNKPLADQALLAELVAKLEEKKRERDALREELQKARLECDNLRGQVEEVAREREQDQRRHADELKMLRREHEEALADALARIKKLEERSKVDPELRERLERALEE